MSEEKKELTKEEKLVKAKQLMKEIEELKLEDDELKQISGGLICHLFDYCKTVDNR